MAENLIIVFCTAKKSLEKAKFLKKKQFENNKLGRLKKSRYFD